MTDFTNIKSQYDTFAIKYHEKLQNPEESFWNNYIERPAMSELLESRVSGKRVLDIGCGSGPFTRMLKDWGADVTGSDISEGLINIAKKQNADIEFVCENAAHTMFDDKTFDIISSSLMVHYFEDLDELFTEMSRILKPAGSFVFSMQHPFKEALKTIKSEDRNKNKYILNRYHHCEPWEFEMSGMKLTSYSHTVQMIFDSLINSGFEVLRLIEPLPSDEGKIVNPGSYKKCCNIPTFIIFEARKK